MRSELHRELVVAAIASAVAAAAPARAQTAEPATGPPASAGPPLAAPPPYDPAMQAGGLAPPPPMIRAPAEQSPPSETERRLDRAKQEDVGRGLRWVWINAEGGFEHAGLRTFSGDEASLAAGFVPTTQSGAMVGIGAGAQLLFLQLGARARVGFFSEWQLFRVGGELGLRLPIGRVEPHVQLGFGYAALGNLGGAIEAANDAIRIRGYYGRVGGGLDYFVTPMVSIGADIGWELLGLARPGVSAADIEKIQADPGYRRGADEARLDTLRTEGTSYGSTVAITAVFGLHF